MAKKDYKGNVAAEAWDAVKDEKDPIYDEIPNISFRENLDYRADKVRETGLAITNFEKEVAKILAAEPVDEAPLAVVESTIDYEAASEGQVEGGPSSSEDTVVEEKVVVVKSGGHTNFDPDGPDFSEPVPTEDVVASLVRDYDRKALEKLAKKAGLDGNSYTNKTELATAIIAAQQK